MKFNRKVAYGGLMSAISVVLMMLTGLFPFAEYSLPALAGVALTALVIDFKKSTALIAYAAVSIISIIIVPSKEAALMFVAFFGYYPIIKSCFETLKSRALEWILKIALFNAAIIAGYSIMVYGLGMAQLVDEITIGFKYGVLILLLLGNVVFIVYDVAVTQLIRFYCTRIRPRMKF